MFSVIFVLGLLYHTYTDLKSMLLYDKTTLILAAVGLVRAWYERQLFDAAYGAGIILAIMLVLYFAAAAVWARAMLSWRRRWVSGSV